MGPKKKIKCHEIETIEDCKRRLRVQLARGNWKEASDICNQLGNQYRLLELFDDALELHKQEIDICKMHNKTDKISLAIAYRNMAEVYIDMKQSPKAVKHIQQYLELAQGAENYVEEQRALITMGRAYIVDIGGDDEEDKSCENDLKRQKALKSAKEWFKKAYTLLMDNSVKEQLNNEKELMVMKCNNCQNLGVTLEMLGDPQAFKWFQKAVDIGKQHGLLEYLHPCYSALSNLYLKQKEGKKALSCAQEAVKAAVAMSSLSHEVEAKLLEAKALFFCDEIESGKKLLKKLRKKISGKEALSVYLEEVDVLLLPTVRLSRKLDQLWMSRNEKNDKKLMKLHESVADNYANLEVHSLAVQNYRKAVEFANAACIAGKKLSSLYFSIAESYKDCGEFDMAIGYYKKEMSLYENSPDEKFVTQTNIAQLFEKWKKPIEAVDAHEKSLELAKATCNPKKVATAYQNFGLYLKYTGDTRADAYLKKWEEINSELSQGMDSQEENLSQEISDDDEEEIDLNNLSSDGESGEEDADSKNVAQAKKRIAKRKNEAGETPLHLAAKRGDLNAVRKYLRQGCEVNARDTAGWTPLHEASNFGFAKVVKELLDHNAKINDPGGRMCEGITPLHDALSNGHFEVAQVLIERGANVLVRDSKNNYPIDHLIIWRNCLTEEELQNVHVEYRSLKTLLKDKMGEKGKVYTVQDEKRAAKQSRLRNKSPEFTIMAASRAHDTVPVRIANDNFDPDNAEEATKEYQNAMRSLLRHSDKKSTPKKENKRPISPGPRNALIPSELDVHEDWMVGDSQVQLRPTAKSKRRGKPRDTTPEDEEDLISVHSSASSSRSNDSDPFRVSTPELFDEPVVLQSPSPVKSRTRRNARRLNSPNISGEEDNKSRDMFSPSPSSVVNKSIARRRTSKKIRRTSPSQIRVIEEEIIIEDVPSPTKPRPSRLRIEEPSFTGNPQPSSSIVRTISSISTGLNAQTKRKRQSSARDVLRLKIKILDKVFLVPVDAENRSMPIEWLCDQAANRYKQANRVKPILSLSTKDGALLCLSDPIDLVLGDDTELVATVLSYDIPALTEAFKKCCADLQFTPRPIIINSLKVCEGTNTLDAAGTNIHGRLARAIFQSIQGNSTLNELRLSECCLSDDDIAELAKVIGTLTGLSVLDLSCNAITFRGVRDLVDGLLSHQDSGAFSIKELNLDYNPLGNEVARKIVELVCLLPNLKKLQMKDCNLSSRFFANLGHEQFSLECTSPREDRFALLDPDLLRSFHATNR